MAMATGGNGCTGSTQPPSSFACRIDANDVRTHGFLHQQKEMLSDEVLMDAYFHAVSRNKHHFRGKVVLNVGTRVGILAFWCAQAGARKVYAIEATRMAHNARDLVKSNGVEDVVEVIEGSMEEIILPEKVDIIISEWMGFSLHGESMFDSVIFARDRWLKPDGVMYPSHSRMWLAPIQTGLTDQKVDNVNCAMNDWHRFVEETEARYAFNMSALTEEYQEETEKYYLKTPLCCNLDPSQIIGTPAVIKEIDCLQATVDEIRTVTAQLTYSINVDRSRISAYAGWFDVQFKGSKQNPATNEVELTTAPDVDGGTHWGQQVFLVNPPISVDEGDKVSVSFKMSAAKQYHRQMDVELISQLELSSGKRLPPLTTSYLKSRMRLTGREDDDDKIYAPWHPHKSGVVIEEIINGEEPSNGDKGRLAKKKSCQISECDDAAREFQCQLTVVSNSKSSSGIKSGVAEANARKDVHKIFNCLRTFFHFIIRRKKPEDETKEEPTKFDAKLEETPVSKKMTEIENGQFVDTSIVQVDSEDEDGFLLSESKKNEASETKKRKIVPEDAEKTEEGDNVSTKKKKLDKVEETKEEPTKVDVELDEAAGSKKITAIENGQSANPKRKRKRKRRRRTSGMDIKHKGRYQRTLG